MVTTVCKRNRGETEQQYKFRICDMRDTYGLTWQEVANILNDEFGKERSITTYRRWYMDYKEGYDACLKDTEDGVTPQNSEELIEDIQKERMKLADERSQVRAMYRRISREETLKEIAKEACENIELKDLTLDVKPTPYKNSECEAILCRYRS